MIYRLLGDATLVGHGLFVLFVVFGGVLVLRRPRLAWLHAPSALWGALIEFRGWICPLTPLENHFRRLGNQAGYEGGFVEHYVLPALYPAGLTREVQIFLGAFVVTVNLVVYGLLVWRRIRGGGPPGPPSPTSESEG